MPNGTVAPGYVCPFLAVPTNGLTSGVRVLCENAEIGTRERIATPRTSRRPGVPRIIPFVIVTFLLKRQQSRWKKLFGEPRAFDEDAQVLAAAALEIPDFDGMHPAGKARLAADL